MKTVSKSGVALFALLLAPAWHAGSEAVHGPCLQKLRIPVYPALARLAGIHGTVHVKLGLDAKCNLTYGPRISDGPEVLQNAVDRAIETWRGLSFTSCSPGGSDVLVSYNFLLKGKPTNEWTPTYVRVFSPYEIEITTQPGDLDQFGLTRKDRAVK